MNRVADDRIALDRLRRIVAASLTVIVCLAVWWYLTNAPVKLNEEQYQIAVALYRACNQRDQDGLIAITMLLDRQSQGEGSDASQIEALYSVVRQARAGQWRDAMLDCRVLLDDQVGRSPFRPGE